MECRMDRMSVRQRVSAYKPVKKERKAVMNLETVQGNTGWSQAVVLPHEHDVLHTWPRSTGRAIRGLAIRLAYLWACSKACTRDARHDLAQSVCKRCNGFRRDMQVGVQQMWCLCFGSPSSGSSRNLKLSCSWSVSFLTYSSRFLFLHKLSWSNAEPFSHVDTAREPQEKPTLG